MENQNQQQELGNFQQNSLPSKARYFFSQNKFTIIIAFILSAISFGATGYFLVANQKTSVPNEIPQKNAVPITSLSPKPTITNQPMPISTPTPTPKSTLISLKTDPSASWSAFASSKYSYSIKYPPNWTAQITTQQDPKILEYVVFNPVSTKAGTLSITLSYGTRTNKEALALDPQIGESIIVASVAATKKNSKDSNGNKATNVIVPFGLNTIVFNAKDAYLSLFNQMLTTLKLTK